MNTSLFVAIVLVVAGLLTLELRISSAIILLLAGVLLSAFVDVRNLSWLEFLAHFDMLGLMFMAGFEVDPAILIVPGSPASRNWGGGASAATRTGSPRCCWSSCSAPPCP